FRNLRQRKVLVDVLREALPERIALRRGRPAFFAAVELARLRDRLAGRGVVVIAVMELRERLIDVDRLLRRFLLQDAVALFALLVGLALAVELAAFDRLLVLVVRDRR